MRFFVCVVLLFVVSVECQLGQDTRLLQEMNNIDFHSILGAPLVAVVDAQAQAARTTTEFIDEVAFREVNNVKEVIMVDFTFEQLQNNTINTYTMHLPFLVMVPIPYLEVKEMRLEFRVVLQSSESQESTASTTWYANSSGRSSGWWRRRTNWSTGWSSSRETKTTGEVNKKFDLKVHYRAGQAEMPRGTERVLDLLENIIREDIPV